MALPSSSDCIAMAREALDLATTAAHFDSCSNILGAIDYYDKAIQSLDEILALLEPFSAESRLLMTRRENYDNRMELLRQFEEDKDLRLGGSLSNRDGATTASDSTTTMTTVEPSELLKNFEMPPKSLAAIPYWQLRRIGCTIEHGGLLSPSLFFSNSAWQQQQQLSFSGLAIKTAALQDVMSTINTSIVPLQEPDLGGIKDKTAGSHTPMGSIVLAFSNAQRDFTSIQNQLARSFSFIPEIKERREAKPATDDSTMDSNSPRPTYPRLAGFMNSMGKNVRKTLESGMSIYNALPSNVSQRDFALLVQAIAGLCARAQVLDEWFGRLERSREEIVRPDDNNANKLINVSESDVAQRVADIETCLTALCHIAAFTRDVVCVTVLRDMEMLLERHMQAELDAFVNV